MIAPRLTIRAIGRSRTNVCLISLKLINAVLFLGALCQQARIVSTPFVTRLDKCTLYFDRTLFPISLPQSF